MDSNGKQLPKMMLGFVVRRCAVAVGHDPSAEEFVEWANNFPDGDRIVRLFGRPISIREARAILRHPGRAVSTRSAQAGEQIALDEASCSPTVVSFAAAVARLKRAGGKP
jgi:hypothetical protein